ncbi:hypothetical protein V8C86DRAFT_2755233 [Haematococcus lacustris]
MSESEAHAEAAKPSRKICRFHLVGACKKGAECPYVHIENDAPSRVCQYWLEGSCAYGEKCRQLHRRPPFPTTTDMPRWRTKISTGTKEPLNSPTQSGTSGSDSVGAGCSTLGAGAVAAGAGASRCLVAPPGTPERSEEDKACYQHPLRPPTPDQDIVKRLSLSALKCGICHKQLLAASKPRDWRFGLMECEHVFCLQCIRDWRKEKPATTATEELEEEAVCGCPICGVTTNMVTPSKTWPKSPADKAAIVKAYHNKLANIDCKEFRGGEGNCRFGSRCLYRHKCKATRPPRATAGAGQAQRAGRAARAVAVDPPQRQRQPKSASGDRGGGGGAQQGSVVATSQCLAPPVILTAPTPPLRVYPAAAIVPPPPPPPAPPPPPPPRLLFRLLPLPFATYFYQ